MLVGVETALQKPGTASRGERHYVQTLRASFLQCWDPALCTCEAHCCPQLHYSPKPSSVPPTVSPGFGSVGLNLPQTVRQETTTLRCTGPVFCAPVAISTYSLTVGGLRSPWRGEYKEPRYPLQDQPTCPQTSPAQQQKCSPPYDTGPAPTVQPRLPPEPPEQSESPTLNLSQEDPGPWEPLPLSSLDLAPARSSGPPERRATLPELELQQLELGRVARRVPPKHPLACIGQSPLSPAYRSAPTGSTTWRSPTSLLTYSSSCCRIISEQPVPPFLSGGTGADSLVSQH